jgi:hypothetical protein
MPTWLGATSLVPRAGVAPWLFGLGIHTRSDEHLESAVSDQQRLRCRISSASIFSAM